MDHSRSDRTGNRESDLIGRAAHDLRTPLNSILGLASLLVESDLTPEQKMEARGIQTAGNALLYKVSDLLDLNRIDRGEFELQPEPIQLRSTVHDVINQFIPAFENRGVSLSQSVDDEVPEWVEIDPDRLKQILVNLLDNAQDHTDSGIVNVSVHQRRKTDGDLLLEFRVSDTGCGMSAEQLRTLFPDDGAGSDQFLFEETTGAGIGLTACRELVSRMNGELTAESEEGEGATVTFTAEARVPDEATLPVSARARSPIEGARVLIVDDSRSIRNYLRHVLEDKGAKVDDIASGSGALEALTGPGSERAYDVVYLDLNLREHSGLDLLETFHERSEAIDTGRVFLITGDKKEDVVRRLPDVPIGGILNKPISESTLMRSMRFLLSGRKPDSSSTETESKKRLARLRERQPRVLAVDDEQKSRWILKKYLADVTGEVETARTGKEAVEKRFETSPDVILMDLLMPGMNGLEAMNRILEREADESKSPVPIIVQSAGTMNQAREKGLAAGADAFLKKPFDREELYTRLIEVLNLSDS